MLQVAAIHYLKKLYPKGVLSNSVFLGVVQDDLLITLRDSVGLLIPVTQMLSSLF